MRNAFYSRASKSIQFYYFYKDGKRVNTCLSHDIIAHETGHAILDGLRPYFLEDSSIRTAPPSTSLPPISPPSWLPFSTIPCASRPAQASGGDMSHDQIISGLAEEFGYYSYGRSVICAAQITAWI